MSETQTDQSHWEVPKTEIVFWDGRQNTHCLVIPVINEGDRIRNLLSTMKTLSIDHTIDIFIVDGGSADGSLALDVLRDLRVRGLLLKTGEGKLSAQLRCAYAFALNQGYEGIVTIDGNDKDDPAAIPQFVAKLREGFDFVQASRFIEGGIEENTPSMRRLAIRYVHAPLLGWRSGFPWTDTTQGFRGYSRRLLLDPSVAVFRNVFTAYELLAYLSYRAPRLGFRCVEIPTSRRYPQGRVPTKIGGWRGYVDLLLVLLTVCLGLYDP